MTRTALGQNMGPEYEASKLAPLRSLIEEHAIFADPPARFAQWLRRVTLGVAMNWLKAFRPGLFKQMGTLEDLDHLDVPDVAPDPLEAVERREIADVVLQAVASLPRKYRVPVTMFHLPMHRASAVHHWEPHHLLDRIGQSGGLFTRIGFW